MLSLLTALVLVAAPLQDTAHVVLVATTDVHGRATDWDYTADRPFAGGCKLMFRRHVVDRCS